MVDHGMFERKTDHITLIPDARPSTKLTKAKFGDKEIAIPVETRTTW